MTATPLCPDVLGYVTNTRANIGIVQAAVGTHPTPVASGRPFEMILLVQNASDAKVDVTATLHLPKQFRAKTPRLVLSLGPAEVGYVTLPVAALPDTPSGSYKLGIEVDPKSTGKPNRTRETTGGAPFDPTPLPIDRARRITILKTIGFSATKRLGRNILDTPVEVLTDNRVTPANVSAGWVSLWTMADIEDDSLLLQRSGELFRSRVLPQLKRDHTLKPLMEASEAKFAEAGYPVTSAEALMIAKVMALVLEYAAPREFSHNPITAGSFNLTPVLSGKAEQTLPHWSRAMLRMLVRDERAASHAVPLIVKMAYDDLLRDAITLAFSMVATATGEDLGTDAEMVEYSERILKALHTRTGLDFTRVYMPLVLGGIIVNEQITTSDTNFVEALRQIWAELDERRDETGERGEPVAEIAETLIERALQTYGFRRGST